MKQDDAHASMSLRQRTLRGVAFMTSRGVLTAVLRVVTIAILARILTPAEFGLVAAVVVLQQLVTVVVNRGLADALVQRAHLSDQDLGTGMVLLLGSGTAAYAAFWFLAPWIETWLSLPRAAEALRGVALIIPLEAAASFYLTGARRNLDFERIAIVDSLAAIIGNTAVAITLAMLGFGFWALIGGNIARAAVSLVGYSYPGWRLHRPAFSFASVRRLFAFTAFTGIYNVFSQVFQSVDKLVLAKVLGAQEVGYYSRAGNFIAMFVEFYALPVNQVLFPVMAKLQHERDRMLAAYRPATAFSSLLGLSGAVAVIVMAKPLVAVLLGAQWAPTVPLIRILGANIFFVIVAQPYIVILRGLGELVELTILTVVLSLAMVIGAIALYPRGLDAVAWWAVSLYAAAFIGDRLILSAKLRTSVWTLLTPMRAGLVYSALLGLLWLALEFGARLSTDTFLGAGVFALLAGVLFTALFAFVPTWFLGRDLLWLHDFWQNRSPFRRRQPAPEQPGV
jgi:PST family polysaccharide transporter